MVELMLVVAVIVIMMSLLMPAISAFGGSAGRRGAVNSLMNTFEQARASALETGSKVYVVMRRNSTVGEGDSYLIARERSDALGDDPAKSYIPLSPWKKMPKGILFHPAPGSLVYSGNPLPAALISSLPGSVPSSELYGMAFNRTGAVAFNTGAGLTLLLAEATQAGSSVKAKAASTTITERLSFRRYTGRAQLDFTAPPQT